MTLERQANGQADSHIYIHMTLERQANRQADSQMHVHLTKKTDQWTSS